MDQCDQIVVFIKGFGNNFRTKVAQTLGNFLGFFKNVYYFLVHFWGKLGYFLIQHLATLLAMHPW